jgi:hypothetical protein
LYTGQAVPDPCSVLIAAADLLPTLKARAAITTGEVLTFTDSEALRALESIAKNRPRIVALERLFAATPRGAALINRIKADPALVQTEIRVLSHDSDYSRIVPRPGAAASAGSPGPSAMTPPANTPAVAPARVERATPLATMEPQELDQEGTRRAPRFKVTGKLDVLVDGNPAALVELSSCGAQVVSPTILKPNQRVRVALTDEAGTVRFSAAIAWAVFEIPPTGPQYRAGLDFVDADAALIERFCERHQAH